MSKDQNPIATGTATPALKESVHSALLRELAFKEQSLEALGKALSASQTRCTELLEETRAQRAELVTLRKWKEDASRRFVAAVMSASDAIEHAYEHALKCEERAKKWKKASRAFMIRAREEHKAALEGRYVSGGW